MSRCTLIWYQFTIVLSVRFLSFGCHTHTFLPLGNTCQYNLLNVYHEEFPGVFNMSNAEKYTGNMRTGKDDFFRDLDSLNDDSESSQRENDTFPLLRWNKTEPVQVIKPLLDDTQSSVQKSKSVVSTPKLTKPATSDQQLVGERSARVSKRREEPFETERLHGRKKRRTQSVQIIPESDQIFKGLIFFFIPNNDISPARRLRIQRSQEYGAVWARVWSTDVTHVIVDKDLNYKEVLKVLTAEQVAVSSCLKHKYYPKAFAMVHGN